MPKFRAYLKDVLINKMQLRLIVQEMMGYVLSNSTKGEKLFFLIGTSGSGKTTLGKTMSTG
jgi:phage/plasmid-associated DNA primase